MKRKQRKRQDLGASIVYLTILIKIIKEAQLGNMLCRDINEYTHEYICIYSLRKYMCVCMHTLEGNENTRQNGNSSAENWQEF